MDENEESKKAWEEYYKKLDDVIEVYRRETNSCILENQKAQDQSIFVIAAALFGLMPFLLDKFQNVPHSECLIVLVLLSNAVALISTLLSFYFCRKGAEEDFELYEQYVRCRKELSQNGSAEASKSCCKDKPGRSCWTSAGMVCNTVSWAFMIATTVLVFLILLLYPSNKEINMASQNNNGSQQNSSVVIGNEACVIKFQPPVQQTPQQPQTKNDNESSKTSKENKDDKKQ